MGVASRAREIFHLARKAVESPNAGVMSTLRAVGVAEHRVAEATGVRVENLKILEIGPGQRLRHLRCFAAKNEVVGIDTDVIPQGRPSDYARMLYASPPIRSAKTLTRKILRQDARFNAALAAALGVSSFPRISVVSVR